MEQYPDYPQYDHRRPWTYHSAAPTTPMSSMYSSNLPARPEPTASGAPRRPSMRRHSERRSDPRAGSVKRSIPHNGASCGNDLCDSPTIAPDERLCPGPSGVDLCSRCYKRFKIERRRAMEDRRAVTDDWRRPRGRCSSVPVTPFEHLTGTETEVDTSHPHEQSARDVASSVNEDPARPEMESTNSRPAFMESHVGHSDRQPSPLVQPAPLPNESPYVDSEATFDGERKTRRTSRSPRKHPSQRARDDPRREQRRSHRRNPSMYEEAEFYKYGRVEEDGDDQDSRGCCGLWSRRRKCFVISIAISLVLLIIIIALAVSLPHKKGFKYTPSTAQVNNTVAFEQGGATRKSVNDTNVGIGSGRDSYTYYQGNASNFPTSDKWVSFQDMWAANLDTFKQSCGWLDRGDNNSPEMIRDMYNAIQDRANASLVDQRIILATVIQETNGCPLVSHTTSSGGTRNPGLMQSHNGHEYNPKHSRLSIMLMIQDGTQGTDAGWGLVDNLNLYGNPYKAMRGYNSGYIPESGDLSEAAGATACYVTDMANRLTGWVRAESTCPGDE